MIEVEKSQTVSLIIRLTDSDALDFIGFLNDKRFKKSPLLEKIKQELNAIE